MANIAGKQNTATCAGWNRSWRKVFVSYLSFHSSHSVLLFVYSFSHSMYWMHSCIELAIKIFLNRLTFLFSDWINMISSNGLKRKSLAHALSSDKTESITTSSSTKRFRGTILNGWVNKEKRRCARLPAVLFLSFIHPFFFSFFSIWI